MPDHFQHDEDDHGQAEPAAEKPDEKRRASSSAFAIFCEFGFHVQRIVTGGKADAKKEHRQVGSIALAGKASAAPVQRSEGGAGHFWSRRIWEPRPSSFKESRTSQRWMPAPSDSASSNQKHCPISRIVFT